MSKRYNIKWRDSDLQDLRRAVKNFNAKITRLAKKAPKEAHKLPEKVTLTELRSIIGTRQDLKREINALRRFSKRGAEKLVVIPDTDNNIEITKWQKQEMARRAGVINRKRKKRLEELTEREVKSRGENLGYTVGQLGMGKADQVALKPMKPFTPKMSNYDIKKKFKAIRKESQSDYWNKKDWILRENYIRALQENYNKRDLTDVIEAIRNMELDDFRERFQSEDNNFEFPYPPDAEQYQQYLSALKAMWIPETGQELQWVN